MPWGLNFDGLSQARRVMERHFIANRYEVSPKDFNEFVDLLNNEKKDNTSAFQRHIFSRVAIPVQIGCVLFDTLITQSLRGLILSFGSLITLDSKKLKVGLTDLLSVVVQMVALPIIAVTAIISPFYTIQGTNFIETHLGQDPTIQLRDEPKEPLLRDRCSDYVLGYIAVLVSIPLMVVRPLIRLPIELLSLDNTIFSCSSSVACIISAVKEPMTQANRLSRVSSAKSAVRDRLFFVYSGNYMEKPIGLCINKLERRRPIESWY